MNNEIKDRKVIDVRNTNDDVNTEFNMVVTKR